MGIYDRSTRRFIDEAKLDLVFERAEWVSTPAGGRVRGDVTILDPQEGRYVESGRLGDRNVRTLPDGKIVEVVATLVLMPDADVRIEDLVTINGKRYEVLTVGGHWATRAEVMRYGANQVV